MDTQTLLQKIKDLEQMIKDQTPQQDSAPSITTSNDSYNGVSEWRKENIEYVREYDRLSYQKKKINMEMRQLQKKYGIMSRSFPKSYNRKKRR